MRTAPLIVASALASAPGSGWAQGATATATGAPVPALTAPASSAPTPTPTVVDRPPVVFWPTMTPVGDSPNEAPLHRPQPSADKDIYERAQELDATLRDAVQDLGFTLYVADPGPAPGRMRDEDLLDRAARSAVGGRAERGTWVISPRIEAAGGGEIMIRIVAVAPEGRELHVRVETASPNLMAVRGLVMLRELLKPVSAAQALVERDREQAERGTSRGIMSPFQSAGRAVLAGDAGLFGAFSAYSAQRASGSDDPRVLYPLLALGTGIGIGAALLVADEWDVTAGDAWVLSAATWWGASAGFLIAAGHDLRPADERYSWGVAGGLFGVGLGAFALTRTTFDEGDAMLAHSGAALGLLVGGATELLYRGEGPTALTPYIGMGYGTAIGLVAAGALATQITVSPSRVMLIDLGVGGARSSGQPSPARSSSTTSPKPRRAAGSRRRSAAASRGACWDGG